MYVIVGVVLFESMSMLWLAFIERKKARMRNAELGKKTDEQSIDFVMR